MQQQRDSSNELNTLKENSNTIYMYILLLISFFLSNFYRISTSVVLPDLALQWGISATATGVISGIFFYAYAFAQPFCGLLNDTHGPIKIAFWGMAMSAVGTMMMSLASSAELFAIGRLFTGLGLAPMLSGALVLQSNCFPIAKYAMLTGITYTIGNTGAIVSVAPLNWLVNQYSFRLVFIGLALFCILIAMLLFFKIKNYRQNYIIKQKHREESFLHQLFIAFRHVFKSGQLKTMLFLWMVICGTIMSFQGLWAVQWFKVVFHVPFNSASFWATLIGIGVATGNFIGGQISRLIPSRRKIIIFFSLSFAVLWILVWILLRYPWSLPLVGIAGLLLGVCAGVEYTQLTAGLNELAPPGNGGVIFGVINCLVFISVAFFQFISGLLIDTFSGQQGGSPMGFSNTYAMIIIIVLLSQLSLPFLKRFNSEK